ARARGLPSALSGRTSRADRRIAALGGGQRRASRDCGRLLHLRRETVGPWGPGELRERAPWPSGRTQCRRTVPRAGLGDLGGGRRARVGRGSCPGWCGRLERNREFWTGGGGNAASVVAPAPSLGARPDCAPGSGRAVEAPRPRGRLARAPSPTGGRG